LVSHGLNDLLTYYGLQLKTSMLNTVAEHVWRKVRHSGQPVKVFFGYLYDAGASSMYLLLLLPLISPSGESALALQGY
jgi:hypothetical protein